MPHLHKPPSNSINGFNIKLFAILFYLFIAFMLTYISRSLEGGIGFLIFQGFLYHFLIRQQLGNRYWLQKNALLLVILFLLALFVFPTTLIPTCTMAILYWLLIGKSHREPPYFIRFHLLTALLLNFLILITFGLFFAATNLSEKLLALFHIHTIFILSLNYYASFLPPILAWGSAIWLSLTALLGRTPYIAVITNNVRHWV